MGKPTGFLEFGREYPDKRDIKTRTNDYKEFSETFSEDKLNRQSGRCMDCGVPFCHNGCPLGNDIPAFNDAIYRKNYEEAYRILASTNNFPEFTGRICPAPCESSCVLGINQPPVSIEEIEKSIIEKAFELGIVKPQIPAKRTGFKVAVIGSGPSGLAAAAQLNSSGHSVTVFERDEEIGGLLRFGIPDFKLEKWVIDRRIEVMKSEGISFQTNANVGVNIRVSDLLHDYDALLLCGGSTIPRDIEIQGRTFDGVYFAMEFLTQQNRRVNGVEPEAGEEILATGKNVIVIGGGDTGSDCVGTSIRHGANSVTQIEILAKPPLSRTEYMPWPLYPMVLRTSSSQEEGCERDWSVLTKEFVGDKNGKLTGLKIADIEWQLTEDGKPLRYTEIPGSEKVIPCELALISAGFLHGQKVGMLDELGVDIDGRGNVKCDKNYQSSVPKVFAAGDMRRGQSLVVWAISEGREAARNVDEYLSGKSFLENRDSSLLNVLNFG